MLLLRTKLFIWMWELENTKQVNILVYFGWMMTPPPHFCNNMSSSITHTWILITNSYLLWYFWEIRIYCIHPKQFISIHKSIHYHHSFLILFSPMNLKQYLFFFFALTEYFWLGNALIYCFIQYPTP